MQTFVFSLPTAPLGATINPSSGEFVWSVPNNAVPSTNLVTVRVTDNGTPILTDVKNFNAVVRPMPQLVTSSAGNQLQIVWPGTETGWRLEAQTNSPGVGISANWVTVSGSTLTNQVFLPINPANGSVFLRLVYP